LSTDQELRQSICDIGRHLWTKGYVAANDGNISVLLDDGTMLTTPTRVSKGFMTPVMLIRVDMAGNVISGHLKPSSEVAMHIKVYENRPDVRAVVHAHPPTATGFAVAGLPLNQPSTPEIVLRLGEIPVAPYATPCTDELALSIVDLLENHDGMLLENHGVLAVGVDLTDAYFKMETIELAAQVSLAARLLGGERAITPENVAKLRILRREMRFPGRSIME